MRQQWRSKPNVVKTFLHNINMRATLNLFEVCENSIWWTMCLLVMCPVCGFGWIFFCSGLLIKMKCNKFHVFMWIFAAPESIWLMAIAATWIKYQNLLSNQALAILVIQRILSLLVYFPQFSFLFSMKIGR